MTAAYSALGSTVCSQDAVALSFIALLVVFTRDNEMYLLRVGAFSVLQNCKTATLPNISQEILLYAVLSPERWLHFSDS